MKDTISTRSTNLAAYLVAKGHNVVRTTQEGRDTLFHFIGSQSLADDVHALKFGQDAVSARALFNARSFLLSLIHGDGVLS